MYEQEIVENGYSRHEFQNIRIRKISNYINFPELSMYAIWSILIISSTFFVPASKSAAVYSNVDFMTKPNFEPLCSAQEERFVESEGKESSLILEFNTAQWSKSCTRILSAPPSYGFIVRLILPKIRRDGTRYSSAVTSQSSSSSSSSSLSSSSSSPTPTSFSSSSSSSSSSTMNAVGNDLKSKRTPTASALNDMTTLIEKWNATSLTSTNTGRTCPLTIFSSLDPHTPQWRLDPCQLEDTAPEMEDPVRLFHGRIRIVWEHSAQTLHSKLMVTALGKGVEQCQSETKHQCLKIGDEPILCISNQLVCDGIRHCPYSNEYDSDEDYAMCWERRRFGEPLPPTMDSDIFEHFALEVFRNLFAFDTPTMPESTGATRTPTTVMSAVPAVTTLRKVEIANNGGSANGSGIDTGSGMGNGNATTTTTTIGGNNELLNSTNNTLDGKYENATQSEVNSSSNTYGRRNSTRSGLSSDFSKYGPWGYLMLGMLLCGGALLICGLWASASQHAANNEREAALQNGAAGFNGSMDHQSGAASPPNYEELDPPPAYSVLFPNQKAGSSATLSSLAAAAMAVPVTAAIMPAAVPNQNSANTTTASITTATLRTTQTMPTTNCTTQSTASTLPVPVIPGAMTRASSFPDTAACSSHVARS